MGWHREEAITSRQRPGRVLEAVRSPEQLLILVWRTFKTVQPGRRRQALRAKRAKWKRMILDSILEGGATMRTRNGKRSWKVGVRLGLRISNCEVMPAPGE
jgi:hypothetical protein